MLLLLLDGAEAGRAERRQAEYRVQPLENLQPARRSLVAYVQIFAQGVDRQR